LTIVLNAARSKVLPGIRYGNYDIQMLTATGVTTLAEGSCEVTGRRDASRSMRITRWQTIARVYTNVSCSTTLDLRKSWRPVSGRRSRAGCANSCCGGEHRHATASTGWHPLRTLQQHWQPGRLLLRQPHSTIDRTADSRASRFSFRMQRQSSPRCNMYWLTHEHTHDTHAASE